MSRVLVPLAIAIILMMSSPVLATDFAFDFRSTAGFVSDPAYAVGEIGATYPHTYTNGNSVMITGGWETPASCNNSLPSFENQNASFDAQIAGVARNITNNSGTVRQCVFRIDLPTTGNWSVNIGVGSTSGEASYIKLQDNGVTFLNCAPSQQQANLYGDANCTIWNSTQWPGSNKAVIHNFTSTKLEIFIGPDAIVTSPDKSAINHIHLISSPVIPPLILGNTIVNQGASQQFTESLGETGTWSCTGTDGSGNSTTCAGSINSSGLYTAPATVTAHNSRGGYQLLPNNHIYNTRIDSLPVNSNSATWLALMSAGNPNFNCGVCQTGGAQLANINFIDNTDATKAMIFKSTHLADGTYLIPSYPYFDIEGGYFHATQRTPIDADHLLHIINTQSGNFTEMYQYFPAGNESTCLTCTSYAGVTYIPSQYSIDFDFGIGAAGQINMPIQLENEEMQQIVASGGTIQHALRMIINLGAECNCFIWPATANPADTPNGVPFGARARLKSTFDCTTISGAAAQILCTQLKQYGLINVDGGSPVWNIDTLDGPWPKSLQDAMNTINGTTSIGSNMEFVDESGLMVSPYSGECTCNQEIVTFTRTSDSVASSVHLVLQGVTIGFPQNTINIVAATPPQQLQAIVHGGAANTVTWSMSPAITGVSLTSGGLLTVGLGVASVATTTVTATSTDNASVKGQLTVVVYPSSGILITGASTAYTDSQGNIWAPALLGNAFIGTASGHLGLNSGGCARGSDNTLYSNEYRLGGAHDGFFLFYVPNGSYQITAKMCTALAAAWSYEILEAQGNVTFPAFDIVAVAGGSSKGADFVSQNINVTNNKLLFVIRRTPGPPPAATDDSYLRINSLKIIPGAVASGAIGHLP